MQAPSALVRLGSALSESDRGWQCAPLLFSGVETTRLPHAMKEFGASSFSWEQEQKG